MKMELMMQRIRSNGRASKSGRNLIGLRGLIILPLLLGSSPLVAQSGPKDLHAFFSPNGGCTDAVISALGDAKKTVLVQADHKIAHNKVMVIDSQTVITGSFNFTKSAETGNAENVLLILHAPELAKRYGDNWKEHLAHSKKY